MQVYSTYSLTCSFNFTTISGGACISCRCTVPIQFNVLLSFYNNQWRRVYFMQVYSTVSRAPLIYNNQWWQKLASVIHYFNKCKLRRKKYNLCLLGTYYIAEIHIFFSIPAYGNLGSVLTSQGRLKEAEWTLRKALQYRPNMAEVHYNL